MKFHFSAYDRAGQQLEDVLEANTVAEVEEELRRRGLFVTGIRKSARCAQRSGGGFWGRTKRLKHLAIFSRQMYVLISSGTPIMEAIAALERQATDEAWKAVLGNVRTQVEKGSTLCEAMERHPAYFDAVARSMVAAGESGGNLAPMLDRLSTLLQSRLHVRKTVSGALVYPALLSSLAGCVMLVMLLFVVPRFGELFDMLDVPLPGTTQVLLDASAIVRGWWWIVLICLAAAGAGVRYWLISDHGRRMIDTIAVRAPQLGQITRNFATARIVRLLGILLDSRVSLVEALQLTRDGMSNSHYAELLSRAEDAVLRGDPVSSAFENSPLVPPSVYEAIRSGEASGQVSALLLNLAGFLEEENEVTLRSLTSIIEPLILVALGLLVGAVAMSMFMPLFDLTSMTQGGG